MSFKFCPECGTATEPGGRFCGACGRTLQPQAGVGGTGPMPLAGVVSLVVLLVLGGGYWLYSRLAPEAPRPLKPGETAPGVMAGAPQGGPMGQGAPHPPFELPEDIKAYMAGLQKEADDAPEDEGKWKTLAGVYYRAARIDPSYLDEAAAAFEHVVEIDERDLDGLRGLGNLAYDRQDRAAAIEYYERYLAVSPADAEVRTDLGTMYYESGQPERAIAEYQRVLATSPSFYQAHFNLAVVHDASGDRAAAHAALEKARDLATEPAVKQRIGTLLEVARAEDVSLADAAKKVATAAPPTGAGATAAVAAATSPAAAAAPPDTFEAAIEQIFRGHRIAGPKVVSVEWPKERSPRVAMAGFPMDQMPDVMKNGFLGKMAQGVKDAQQKFGVDGPVVVEIVDHASGKIMATVDSSQDQP